MNGLDKDLFQRKIGCIPLYCATINGHHIGAYSYSHRVRSGYEKYSLKLTFPFFALISSLFPLFFSSKQRILVFLHFCPAQPSNKKRYT